MEKDVNVANYVFNVIVLDIAKATASFNCFNRILAKFLFFVC